MKNSVQTNGAAPNFAAEDIINPVALAAKLRASDHPFAAFLLGKFSDTGRVRLAILSGPGADDGALADTLASEFNAIVTAGQSLHDPVTLNGTKLRKSTNKLLKQNPQGPDLIRFNTLLIQDVFPEDLDHDSCELVETVKKKGVEFRIYKERRKLKTTWNESYRITFPTTEGSTSTHARTLEEAHQEIKNTLVDQALSGEAPVTKQDSKERDAKAAAYNQIAAEAAKVGRTDSKGIQEFMADAVKAQLKLGFERPLLDFVTSAVEVMVKPVVRCLLQSAAATFFEFVRSRKDVSKKEQRHFIAVITRFASAMPKLVHERNCLGQPADAPRLACPADVYADEIRANDVQKWLNSMTVTWRYRRDSHDRARSFLKYCRDALHALPPGLPTAAHLVPRTKPDTDYKPTPAPVLSFCDVWRIFINLQDLETVWFFALAVFAGLHQSEIARLEWQNDIIWESKQIFVASGKGKDRHRNRMGAFVNIVHPLDMILALGRGRTGRVVTRQYLRQQKITPLANRLSIAWVESIMRHSFISYLLGLGFSFNQVSRQARNTEPVLKRHYYAPIPKFEAERFFSLPIPFELISQLPIHRRNWDQKSIKEFQIRPDGTCAVVVVPAPPAAPRVRRVLKKRQARIVWPDDLELQVMLWEKSQEEISHGLNCRQTTVSRHALARGLITPKSDFFVRVKYQLPVEIPEAVLKAREELAARKKAAANGGEAPATPPAPPALLQPAPKPEAQPENSNPNTNPQPEN